MDTENASLMEQSTLDREAVVMLRTHLTDTKSAASIKQAEDDKKIAELTATLRRAYEVWCNDTLPQECLPDLLPQECLPDLDMFPPSDMTLSHYLRFSILLIFLLIHPNALVVVLVLLLIFIIAVVVVDVTTIGKCRIRRSVGLTSYHEWKTYRWLGSTSRRRFGNHYEFTGRNTRSWTSHGEFGSDHRQRLTTNLPHHNAPYYTILNHLTHRFIHPLQPSQKWSHYNVISTYQHSPSI